MQVAARFWHAASTAHPEASSKPNPRRFFSRIILLSQLVFPTQKAPLGDPQLTMTTNPSICHSCTEH